MDTPSDIVRHSRRANGHRAKYIVEHVLATTHSSQYASPQGSPLLIFKRRFSTDLLVNERGQHVAVCFFSPRTNSKVSKHNCQGLHLMHAFFLELSGFVYKPDSRCSKGLTTLAQSRNVDRDKSRVHERMHKHTASAVVVDVRHCLAQKKSIASCSSCQ